VTPVQGTWKQIAELLESAAAALPDGSADTTEEGVRPGQIVGSLAEFREFLDHNELELAWDALAAVARESAAGSTVWFMLGRAASMMGLNAQKDVAVQCLSETIGRDEPNSKLVYMRRVRGPKGRFVWRRPAVRRVFDQPGAA
jgi:hypothetical protein